MHSDKLLMKQLNIGSLNLRGLLNDDGENKLYKDATFHGLDIIALSETHIKSEQHLDLLKDSNNKSEYVLYSTNNLNDQFHGVGFLVNTKLRPKFERITDRICTADIKLKHNRLKVISCYAPTLKTSENNPQLRDDFYTAIDTNS